MRESALLFTRCLVTPCRRKCAGPSCWGRRIYCGVAGGIHCDSAFGIGRAWNWRLLCTPGGLDHGLVSGNLTRIFSWPSFASQHAVYHQPLPSHITHNRSRRISPRRICHPVKPLFHHPREASTPTTRPRPRRGRRTRRRGRNGDIEDAPLALEQHLTGRQRVLCVVLPKDEALARPQQ